MNRRFRSTRWLVALAVTTASCSQGDSARPSAPSAVTQPGSTVGNPGAASSTAYPANDVGLPVESSRAFGSSGAEVRTSAAGDVRNGPIDILRVRVGPASTPAFFADPGGTYRVRSLDPVEFWVEWESSTPLAQAPRLAIDWDFSEPDNIHCGPCRLTKSIPAGLHQVTIRMDDRAGGVTTRTFSLSSEFFIPDPVCKPVTTGSSVSASLNASGPLQPGRIVRNGIPSACPSKPYPGTTSATRLYAFRTHTFNLANPGATCLRVDFDPNPPSGRPCGTNAHASAYLGDYDPFNQASGFLGDVGSSASQPFHFMVTGDATFLIVVTNTAAGAASTPVSCDYRFSFSSTVCQ